MTDLPDLQDLTERSKFQRILEQRLCPEMKGVPVSAYGKMINDVGALGLNLLREDLPMPVAIIREPRMLNNMNAMMNYVRRKGIHLCPHGKTTMAPQLFHLQMQQGCWGITLATPAQVQVCAQFGFKRVVLANQLVDEAGAAIIAEALNANPDLQIYLIVDSLAGLEFVRRHFIDEQLHARIHLLIELGLEGGRTGLRTIDDALALGREIVATNPFRLAGVESFEGVLAGPDDETIERRIAGLMDLMGDVLDVAFNENWFDDGKAILTAGGSAYFDVVADRLLSAAEGRNVDVILRSGCYLTHDSGYYARHAERRQQRQCTGAPPSLDLSNALEVWARVQSTPEVGLAICTLGKRDISHDMDLPVPLHHYRIGKDSALLDLQNTAVRCVGLNDHHAYLKWDGESPSLAVGDLIGFGISHPCTTFDRWQILYGVDEHFDVQRAYRTFF